MSSYEDRPECHECVDASQDPERISGRLESLPRMKREELLKYEDEVERMCQVRHLVVPAGMVAEYDAGSERWHCSYGNHSHKSGLLVRSLCRRLLSLANYKCGKESLVGFAAVADEWRLLSRLEAERHLQVSRPREMLERSAAIFADATEYTRGLNDLHQHIPALRLAMFEALTHRNRRNVEVPVEELDHSLGRRVEKQQLRTLRGLEFFRRCNPEELAAVRADVEAYAHEMNGPPVSRDDLERVSSERERLETKLDRLEDWIREASSFWSGDNLSVACFAAFGRDLLKVVEIDGSRIRLKSSGVVLGLRGLVQ